MPPQRPASTAQEASASKPIRLVWMVSREYDQLAGVGGIKDVCRQLAETLAARGDCAVRVILPRYGCMDPASFGFSLVPISQVEGHIAGRRFAHVIEVDMDYVAEERRELVAIWRAEINGVVVFLVEAERFATKQGIYTYTEEEEQKVAWQRKGSGHFDYFAMNILLQKAALDLIILLDEHPDVIHCHDGHAATLPAMMREHSGYRHYFRHTGAVVTLHNAGAGYHQEVADLAFAQAVTGLPKQVIIKGRLEENFDPFVSAANYAVLNTVSEQYAKELQETPEDVRTGWLGHALLTRGVRLAGITNGIDPAAFDPRHPVPLGLATGYDVLQAQMEGKRRCKEALLADIARQGTWEHVRQHGILDRSLDRPLFTFIGRLTPQKGVDILIQALHTLLPLEPSFQFLFFGSGALEFEQELEQLAQVERGWGRVCFLQGYAPQIANQVYAAGDFFVIPSRYEPCGLTDYIAQLFGNLPIVHRVGGLVKVIDRKTGFTYNDNTSLHLAEVMAAALAVYHQEPETIRAMQQRAVQEILRLHTWETVLESYLDVYRQAMPTSKRDA
jgi:starch synthase